MTRAVAAFVLIGSWAAIVPPPARAQGLPAVAADALVARCAAYVDGHFEEQIALLESIVNVNSGTMNFEGVRAVGSLLGSELSALGFEVRWVAAPGAVNRAGHLVASKTGRSGLRVLLLGHLDTVFPAAGAVRGFRRDGDRITGHGVEDMKNGLVVLVSALRTLAYVGALGDARITVVLTGDEEDVGVPESLSRDFLVHTARAHDVVLSFEPGEPGVVVTTRRGFSGWRLAVGGQGGHSSRIFGDELGGGAVFEAVRILGAFYDQLRHEPYLTFNPGIIAGGTRVQQGTGTGEAMAFGKANVVASEVIVEGDLRFLSDAQKQNVQARMLAIAARNLPRTRATLTFDDSNPAMSPRPGNETLRRLYSDVSQAVGTGPLAANDPMTRGAGDVCFVSDLVSGALDGLGGSGGGAHSDNEWLDVASFRQATKRAAVFLHRLVTAPPPLRP